MYNLFLSPQSQLQGRVGSCTSENFPKFKNHKSQFPSRNNSTGEGVLQFQAGGTPVQVRGMGYPHLGLGYPLIRTRYGMPPPGQDRMGYPLARTGRGSPLARTGWGTLLARAKNRLCLDRLCRYVSCGFPQGDCLVINRIGYMLT